MRSAVFLDRDGTLNLERHFLRHPDELDLVPGTLAALRKLDAAGLLLVVATNQSGIARGYVDEPGLARIHERLHGMLEGLPRAYFHCPHHPDQSGPFGGACRCRKPGLGMLEDAAELLQIDLASSYVVGDSARDLMRTADLGLHGILVRSGKPWREQLDALRSASREPDHVADDIAAAADLIIDHRARGPGSTRPARCR